MDNNAREDGAIRVALWPTVALFLGLALLYIGERAIGEPAKYRFAADALGALLLLGGVAGRALAWKGATDASQRRAEGWMLAAGLVMVAALCLYFPFAINGSRESLREALGKGFDRADGLVAVLWPMLILGAGLPALMMQRAMISMTDGHGAAEHIEVQRVRYSAAGGITVALALVFCIGVNYFAADRNVKYDMARFRSTRPSPATVKLVENLSKPIRATIFLPVANEVREQVEPYFADLGKRSPNFTYEVLDHALEPVKAKDLSATGNGLIVLGILGTEEKDKGKVVQKEILNIGLTLEGASSALQTFDGDVQKRLLLLTRPGRVVYFTVGHGERGFDRFSASDIMKEDLRAPIGALQQALLAQGFEVKTLGVGQGLGNKVPGDATLVFVPGPTDHFLPGEVTALTEYLQRGGRIFLSIDPTSEVAATDLQPLLKAAGIKFHPDLLANSEAFFTRTSQAADRANVAVQSFSSHASISTLSRLSGRLAVVMPRAGWMESDGSNPAGVQLDFTLRTPANTWLDANKDFTHDKEEKQQVFQVGAAASRSLGSGKEWRLIVLSSIEAVTDLGLMHRPNGALVGDGLKWLVGDEAIAAETVQETDQPIVHTRSQDKIWFYLTVFAAPALVLAVGLLYTRQVRRRRAS